VEGIGDRIRKLRESKNMTQTELSEFLGMKTYTTVSKWESNDNFPKGKDLKKIAEFFNVSSDYLLGLEVQNKPEGNITTIYSQLNVHRKKKVYKYAENQLEEQNNDNIIQLDFSDVSIQSKVSAGTGILDLDPENAEMISYRGKVPPHYDLAFRVAGNSMEPAFSDGDIIFVEKIEYPINGAIMVVQIDDEAFIKKVYLEENRLRLVSLNPDYKDKYANIDNDIHIVGKVVF